ncbi:hypothetical protein ACFQYP_45190 [Nonomuraea antimicrobica]
MSQVSHVEGFADFVRSRFAAWAKEAGFGEDRYAEAFQVVPTG